MQCKLHTMYVFFSCHNVASYRTFQSHNSRICFIILGTPGSLKTGKSKHYADGNYIADLRKYILKLGRWKSQENHKENEDEIFD